MTTNFMSTNFMSTNLMAILEFHEFIPTAPVLFQFSIACILLFIAPGPDMSLFLAKTLAGGRRAGIASMLGACSGCLVHTILAALGLSVLIAASPTAFTIMKLLGALYLLWLAWGAIAQGSALNITKGEKAEISLARTFWLGVGVNLTNPKVVLFFITFLPQFVAQDDAHASGKLLFLGVYFVVFTIPMAILMILGAERLIDTLRTRPRIMRWIDYAFAGIFGAFAIKILATQGK